MDSKHNQEGGQNCPFFDKKCERSCLEEAFELPDSRTVCACEETDLIWVDGKDEIGTFLPLQAGPEYGLFDRWLSKKLSWNKDDITHLDYISPEKATTQCVTIHNSLSHSFNPASLIHSIDNNSMIREFVVLFHNASSREAIHCGSHWPIWQQQANYFFSPKAIKLLMESTSFKLKASYPVEFLMHKYTMMAKRASHPKTAFWRGRVRSLIHRIGGRLNTDDAGHIIYLFSRDA